MKILFFFGAQGPPFSLGAPSVDNCVLSYQTWLIFCKHVFSETISWAKGCWADIGGFTFKTHPCILFSRECFGSWIRSSLLVSLAILAPGVESNGGSHVTCHIKPAECECDNSCTKQKYNLVMVSISIEYCTWLKITNLFWNWSWCIHCRKDMDVLSSAVPFENS